MSYKSLYLRTGIILISEAKWKMSVLCEKGKLFISVHSNSTECLLKFKGGVRKKDDNIFC